MTYELTKTTKSAEIPVGIDVITKLGTTTTFSRLASGNNIAIIMQGDNIMKIYIVE